MGGYNEQSASMVALMHILKVALYIFISAGLTAILNQLGQFHLQPTTQLVISGIINMTLSWLQKFQEVRSAQQ
jgi:hypothetical protein